MMLILLGIFVAIILLLVKVYRGRNTSGKIVFKLVLALLSIVFTFSMVIAAVESRSSYKWAEHHYSLEGRLEIADQYVEEGHLARLANLLVEQECYEPEFEEYWTMVMDAEKKTVERLK